MNDSLIQSITHDLEYGIEKIFEGLRESSSRSDMEYALTRVSILREMINKLSKYYSENTPRYFDEIRLIYACDVLQHYFLGKIKGQDSYFNRKDMMVYVSYIDVVIRVVKK